MDDAKLARLVRQHAETSRLMGVDFVPAFSRGGIEALPMESDQPAAPVAPVAPAKVTAPQAPAAKVPQAAAPPASAAPTAPTAPAVHVVEAKPLATPAPKNAAKTQAALDELKARYEREAPHRQFVTAHTRIVFGEGDPCARLVFVGEAPGEEEDRTGRPFVGRSGELLTKMIIGMGLSREQVYICNVMKTRPPDNATPTATEIALCEPYLREQIGIIAPEAIVTLGLPAARALLHTQESMTKMRGRWRTYELSPGRVVPLMPTFHPAYVLRNYTEETRGQVWSDLCDVIEKLGMPRPVKAKPGKA
ncbi:MAG: uracil-DNA glycosylase [Phycisphaerales bacterium]|jgi:DNA polymerase